MPRFMGDNYIANLKLLGALNVIAHEAGCTAAQLSLAWLLHKAPHIIPIPGTTSVAHLQEDLGAMDVQLGADVIARLEALINQHTVAGSRYNAQATSEVDTENF
jgi:aryl-alcohol dehydrogenase-like predicted oxidoreductase